MQRVVVPRWIQLVVLPLALLGIWDLARVSGSVLLIVTAASVIAMILNPLSKQFEHVLPRGLAILASYLLVLLVVAAIALVLANPVANQVNHFSNNIPTYINQANRTLDNIQTWLNHHGVRVHIKKQGQSALTSLEHTLTKSSGSIVSFSRDVLGKAISFGIDLVLTFVLSVYLLVYARQIGQLVRRIDAARRRHPRRRLPAVDPARGVRLRPRAAAVQPGDGRQRDSGAVPVRAHRAVPGRAAHSRSSSARSTG